METGGLFQSWLVIVTSISTFIVSIVAIFTFVKKLRIYVVNKLVKDVKVTELSKDCDVYNSIKAVEEINKNLEQIRQDMVTSKTYQENYNKSIELMTDLRKSTLRLEIGRLLDHEPKNKDTIMRLYDVYKKMGGNSYMDSLINKWKEIYL